MDGRRSRSSSRSRSPRRKHRKHKRHSRRSRSRDSRSRSRSTGRSLATQRIHLNPAFGIGPSSMPASMAPVQMGYSASRIVHQNNMLEAEVMRLKAALLAEQGAKQIEIGRANMLNQEMRNITIQKNEAQKQYTEVVKERRMMIEMKTEMANRMNQLDTANRQLRDDLTESNLRFEAKNEDIQRLQYQAEIMQKQIAGINERNGTLKTKCEAMVAQNRRLQDEIDEKQKIVETSKLNVQKAETDLQLANMEIKRLNRELELSQSNENTRFEDKNAMELALARKDDEIRLAAYKSAAALKSANDTILKLENRLKTEKPAQHDDLSVLQETIYAAIETMKQMYEKQLTRLEEEVEVLKADRLKEHGETPQGHQVEELPDYLQTPRKPDPTKMDGLIRTNQVKIAVSPMERAARASSGPPVDMPVAWHMNKMDGSQEGHSSTIPLFGTTGTVEQEEKDAGTSIHVDVSQREEVLDEEDLLGADPDQTISPSTNLELMEQQLLGDCER